MAKAQGLQIQAFTEVLLRQRLVHNICYFTRDNQIFFVWHISVLKQNLSDIQYLGKTLFNTDSGGWILTIYKFFEGKYMCKWFDSL